MSAILATYLIETPLSLEAAATAIAGEQSTGTFVRVAGETDAIRARHGASVERIERLPSSPAPSLAGAVEPTAGQFERGRVTIAFPFENVGASLSNTLATVAGNLFELRELSGIKLVDLDLPESFGEAYRGPAFGVAGTRRLTGVAEGPILGTIIKPSVGLSPEATGVLVGELAAAGLDFIKDDELMANPPHSPFLARLEAVMRAIEEHADRTGKKVMYAANITDDLDQMRRHHDDVVRLGGTSVMVSLHAVGVAGVSHLRTYSELPIHGHRNGWGMYTRHPMLGVEYTVMQKIWRVAGVDHLHVNGLRNKFWEPDASVIASAKAVLAPLFPRSPMLAVPVFSSAQGAWQAADTLAQLGSEDLLYVCGGSVMAHPMGVASGVASIREAWDAARAGISLDTYAIEHPALKAAVR